MFWQETENSYSTTVESFLLDKISFQANRSDLSRGIALKADNEPLMQLFAPSHTDLKGQPDQSYLRGNDLVGFFSFQDYVAECYWSPHRDGSERIELEAMISLRSTLLKTTTINLSSIVRFESNKIQSGLTNRDFVGPDNVWFSFSIHPQDADAITIQNSDTELDFKISIDHMERGVIRRIRLLMTLGQGKLDTRTLKEIDEKFARSPIPLTT